MNLIQIIYLFIKINNGNWFKYFNQWKSSKKKNETDFKTKEIKKCHKKFGILDKDKKGYVSITDVVSIPEIENNPLRYHIAQYMSNDNENEDISFEAFIKVIDYFKNNKTEKQYKFIYDLFDFDKDGKISNE